MYKFSKNHGYRLNNKFYAKCTIKSSKHIIPPPYVHHLQHPPLHKDRTHLHQLLHHIPWTQIRSLSRYVSFADFFESIWVWLDK